MHIFSKKKIQEVENIISNQDRGHCVKFNSLKKSKTKTGNMSKSFLFFNFLRTTSSQSRPFLISSRTYSVKGSKIEENTNFKSSIHTDNLYPGSKSASKYANFDLSKLPTKEQTFTGFIPMKEIEFTYSHSSGPGGQNVDKVIFFI